MDVMEKLVELLCKSGSMKCDSPTGECTNCLKLADHLIANGVTVQEWIPVSDPPKEKGKFLVLNEYGLIYSADYCNIHKGFGDWFDDIDGDWGYFSQDLGVTHWMPLPPAPKGE